MKRVLFAFCMLVLMPVGYGAYCGSATPDSLTLAAQLVEICGRLMPNNPEIEKAIEKLGFSTARWNGRFHVLEDPTGQVAVIVSGLDTYDKHCGILVSGMTPKEAEALVAPWLARTNAEVLDAPESQADKTWSGLIEGFIVRIALFETSRHESIDGAWVRMVLRDKPI